MAGLFTADNVIFLAHLLINIFIADLGGNGGDAFPFQGLEQAEVGHDGGDDIIVVQNAEVTEPFAGNVQNMVTGQQFTVRRRHDHPVRVAVEGQAQIISAAADCFLHHFRMRGTAVCIDVDAVRAVVQNRQFRAQPLQQCFGREGAGPVGTVNDQTHARQVERVCFFQPVKICLQSFRIGDDLADPVIRAERQLGFPVNELLDQVFDVRGKLDAFLGEDLDAVVIERVVAG